MNTVGRSGGKRRSQLSEMGIAVVLAVLICSGCATSRYKSPSDDNLLTQGQGIIGLVIAGTHSIRRLTIRGSNVTRLATKNLDGETRLLLFKVTPGVYCLTEVSFADRTMNLERYDNTCFRAIAGAIGYIGHYLFDPESRPGIAVFDKPVAFENLLHELYPKLASRYRVADLRRTYSTRRDADGSTARRIALH